MKPWEEFPNIWKTESSFWSWIRGGIRAGLWKKNPVKLEFIKQHRTQIANPNPRGKKLTVYGGICCLCENEFPLSMIEVDHVRGNHSLKSVEDLKTFIQNIAFVTFDDLQLVCKPCHKTKSYADKQGISFEEAMLEKKIIEVCKLPAKKLDEWLEANNSAPYKMNSAGRKEAVRKILEGK